MTENQLDVHSLICLFRGVGTSTSLKGAIGFPCRGSTQTVLQESSTQQQCASVQMLKARITEAMTFPHARL